MPVVRVRPARRVGTLRRQPPPVKIGSLCTGIRGLDIAAEAFFDAETVWCSEFDATVSRWLADHSEVPNLGDLTAIDWSQIQPVDILTAGYPCQPFSHAGRRKGTEDARHLWPHIAEAVRVLRPRWVVLENVAGHLSLGFGAVLRDLAEAGFDAEWCVLRASDVGACHQRERLFIVARDSQSNSGGTVPSSGGTWGSEGPPRSADRTSDIDVLPTPTAWLGRRPSQAIGDPGRWDDPARSRELSDCIAALERDATLPTPTAQDGGGSRNSTAQRGPNAKYPHTGDTLTDALYKTSGAPPGTPVLPGSCPPIGATTSWGKYEAAIRRHEQVFGRSAPDPKIDGRLSPRFVEWMMGYPKGWVGDMTRTRALKALGNAVVPQQAFAALLILVPAHAATIGGGPAA